MPKMSAIEYYWEAQSPQTMVVGKTTATKINLGGRPMQVYVSTVGFPLLPEFVLGRPKVPDHGSLWDTHELSPFKCGKTTDTKINPGGRPI
jgi:hypothetical protein